jgi:hypothetical protein
MLSYIIIDGDLGGMWEKMDGGTLHGGSRMSVNPFFCSKFKHLYRFILLGNIIDFISSGFASFLTFNYPARTFIASLLHLCSSHFFLNVYITSSFPFLYLSTLRSSSLDKYTQNISLQENNSEIHQLASYEVYYTTLFERYNTPLPSEICWFSGHKQTHEYVQKLPFVSTKKILRLQSVPQTYHTSPNIRRLLYNWGLNWENLEI